MAIPANVVNVTVTKTTAAVTRQGFGTPLLLAQVDTGTQSERFKTYASTTAMTDAGFAADDNAVVWAGIVFGQDVAPDQIAIGRRTVGTPQVDTVTITTADPGTWSVDINGEVIPFIGGAGDEQAIAVGLADAINASNQPVDASVPIGGVFTVTASVGGDAFTNGGIVVPGGGVGTFVNTTPNGAAEDITTALDAVEAENANGWYFLNIEDRDNTDILAAAAWVNSRKKIAVFQSEDPTILTGAAGSIAGLLAAFNYKRVGIMYHDDPNEFLDGGMTGIAAAADLDAENGVITWYGKQIIGVPVDVLTEGEITLAAGDNELDNGVGANVHTDVGGRGFVQGGKSVEGEFMDVQTTIDWTEFRVQEAVFAPIATTPTKVPGTNAGVAVISNEVLGVLNTGVANGHFSTDTPPTVTAPTTAQRTTADKNARVLRNVIGTAQLAGAIHKTIVQVNVNV